VTYPQRQVVRALEVVDSHFEGGMLIFVVAREQGERVEGVVPPGCRRHAVPLPRVRAAAGRDIVLLDRVRVKPLDYVGTQ